MSYPDHSPIRERPSYLGKIFTVKSTLKNITIWIYQQSGAYIY